MLDRISFKTQLQLVSVAGLVVLAVAFWFNQSAIVGTLEEHAQQREIARTQRLFQESVRNHVAMLAGSTKSLTRNRGLIKSLKVDDRGALTESARPTFNRLSAGGMLNGLVVADRGGQIRYYSSEQAPDGLDGFLAHLSQSRKQTHDLGVIGGQPVLLVGFPLYARGKPVGAGVYYVELKNLVGHLAGDGLSTWLLAEDRKPIFSSDTTESVDLSLLSASDMPVISSQEQGGRSLGLP